MITTVTAPTVALAPAPVRLPEVPRPPLGPAPLPGGPQPRPMPMVDTRPGHDKVI